MKNKRIHSLLLCMMLIVAMALGTVGCNTKTQEAVGSSQSEAVTEETAEGSQTEATAESVEGSQTEAAAESVEGSQTEAATEETAESEVQVLGVGQTKFLFTVVDKEGNETNFEIHTDKETVGAALLELELIAGEDGEFGLYVKTVNGMTADYDVDQTYWAFYIDGEYAMSGVDVTIIEEGKTYAFKVEK